jgi:hypothetical protein
LLLPENDTRLGPGINFNFKSMFVKKTIIKICMKMFRFINEESHVVATLRPLAPVINYDTYKKYENITNLKKFMFLKYQYYSKCHFWITSFFSHTS